LVKKNKKRKDLAFTPKLGWFINLQDLSVFASYANSFTPNTGTTVDLKAIEPSIMNMKLV
jgi:iron complex outermembrane receptor protein